MIAYYTTLIFHLLLTYFFTAIVVFQVFSVITKCQPQEARTLFFLCLGLGPMTLSWILALLLWLTPHHSNHYYLFSIYFVFAAGFILFFPKLQLLKSVFTRQTMIVDGDSKLVKFLSLILYALILLLVFLAVALPLIGNDQLDYVNVSKLIFQAKNTAIYPVLDLSGHGGYYAPWTHPLAFMTLYVWHFIQQGNDFSLVLARLVASFFAISSVLLVRHRLAQKSLFLGNAAAILLISAPLYFIEAATNHIDALRIFTFLLTFIVLGDFLKNRPTGYRWLLAYSLGMCLFSHSIGILAIPIMLGIFILHALFIGKNAKQCLIDMGVVLSIGLIFVLPRYTLNLYYFHSLVHDGSPIWKLKSLDFKHSLDVMRGISVGLPQWVYGVFQGFSRYRLFGLTYWVLLLYLLKLLKPHLISWVSIRDFFTNNTEHLVSLLVVLAFYGMVVLSVMLGMNVFIKNSRYMMTIQPMIAILGAYAIYPLWRKVRHKEGESHDS